MRSVLLSFLCSSGGLFVSASASSKGLSCAESSGCDVDISLLKRGASRIPFSFWGCLLMQLEKEFFQGSKNPICIFQSLHFDSEFFQKNPDFFHPDGIIVFTGPQGSGKSLSACKCVKRIKKRYPKAIVCSNLQINGIDDVIPFTDYEQIKTLDNGTNGVIFFIDEIHVLWNSLESKSIPISEMAVFCQMRKARRVIIGTSQVYGRIAKPIREQLKYAILCKSYFKYLQVNTIVDPNGENSQGEKDGTLDGEVVYKSWFFHRPSDYQAYNTYTKIEKLKRNGVKI